ncbi:amidase [Janibacter alkaliphilus]|uniref:Amidase n=1 Tax=Janibacter alkaliphilus TaxID=1069963 RepID=A0A852WZ54_9MICO|nr:amidase [Janibacter alkaliphilus]NYG36126.1 amidase [Janibacter alkaliphilus]
MSDAALDEAPTGHRVHAVTDDALGDLDATGVAQRLRAGEVSPGEVLEAALARTERVAELGAVSEMQVETARSLIDRAAASAAPFAGVPTVIKENVTVAGQATTMGSAAVPHRPESRHGGFVRQLLDLGVVPFARSTCPPFGWTATTEYPDGRVTRNPWHTGYSSGGSSGGSAALVAAGAVPIAHGNDGGGSIRIPAAACGLVGLKASRGRVLGDPHSSAPINVVSDGVLARSVRDVARAFAGLERSYRNPRLAPIGLVEGPGARRLRVGVTHDSPVAPPTDAETRAAVDRTVDLLGGLGHDVEGYEPAVPGFFRDDFEDYWSFLAFAIHRGGRKMFGDDFDPAALDPLTLGLSGRMRRRLPKMPLVLARLAAVGAGYERRFGDVDVVLTPVLTHTTPPIGHLAGDLPFAEHFSRLGSYVGFTPLHNAAGAPAISLPLGQTAEGRPIGVMLSARRGQERVLLELALELEAAAPFARIQD